MADPFAPWRRVALEDGEQPEPTPGAYAAFPHLHMLAELYVGLTKAGVGWDTALKTDLWLLGVLMGADGIDRSTSREPQHPWEIDLPSDPDEVEPADPAVMGAFMAYLEERRAEVADAPG